MTASSPAAASNENISDEVLITRIAAGDRRAFESFTRHHGDFLFATAVRMMRTRPDAEDVAQETLLRVWQKAATWSPSGGASVRTWVYRIAYNLCIDMIRRRRPSGALPETLSSPEQADDMIKQKERAHHVGEALKQLPERQRAALVLCHYQGLSNGEAADVMGTSVKSIESLLIRARRQMRAILQPLQEGL